MNLSDLIKKTSSEVGQLESENREEHGSEQLSIEEPIQDAQHNTAAQNLDNNNSSSAFFIDEIASDLKRFDEALNASSGNQKSKPVSDSFEDDFCAIDEIGGANFVAPTASADAEPVNHEHAEASFNDAIHDNSQTDVDAAFTAPITPEQTGTSFVSSANETESIIPDSSLPEAQEFFSEQGVLPKHRKAEDVRSKLEMQKEFVHATAGHLDELDITKPSDEPEQQDHTNQGNAESQEMLNPFFSSLVVAAESIARLGSGLANAIALPQAKLDEYRSKEKRFSRYTAKSTKAQKRAIGLSNEMIIKADAFKQACDSAGVQPYQLARDNMDLITSKLGDKGAAIKSTYNALSNAVVDHELALIELDDLTAEALKANTIGLNTLARQNENVKRYQQNMERVSEAFQDVPLFGAKEKLENHKTMKEKYEAMKQWLSSSDRKLGELMKDIADRLKAILASATTYICNALQTKPSGSEPVYGFPSPAFL